MERTHISYMVMVILRGTNLILSPSNILPAAAFKYVVDRGTEYYDNVPTAQYVLIVADGTYQIKQNISSLAPFLTSEFLNWYRLDQNINQNIAMTLKLQEPGAASVRKGNIEVVVKNKYFVRLNL